jgi:hypothetical protein
MQKVILTRAYCDDHMGECWQSFNEATQKTECVPSYTEESQRLKAKGYIYTGHRAGQYTYALRKSAPLALPLDWQMAIEERQTKEPEYIQDW